LFLDLAERLQWWEGDQFVIVGPRRSAKSHIFNPSSTNQEEPLKEAWSTRQSRDIPISWQSFDVFFLPTRAEPSGWL
jgi:hypothetical protein